VREQEISRFLKKKRPKKLLFRWSQDVRPTVPHIHKNLFDSFSLEKELLPFFRSL